MQQGIISMPKQSYYPEDHDKIERILFENQHPILKELYSSAPGHLPPTKYQKQDVVIYPLGICILKEITDKEESTFDIVAGYPDISRNYEWTDIETLPPATELTLGGIKVGNLLTISEDGTLSALPGSYDDTDINNRISNVEQGNFLTDKVLSDNNFSNEDKIKLDGIEAGASSYTLPIASQSSLGGIILNDKIVLNEQGQITQLGYEQELTNLTDNHKIKKVSIVNSLPSLREAETLYLIEEGV